MCDSMSKNMNNSQSYPFGSPKPKTKLIDINDEKSLKENHISYDDTVSEFTKIFKNGDYLSVKIEKEISNLNKSRKQILNKINRFFRKKHHLLTVKHKSLKSSINEKVDEVEEDLNAFLILAKSISLSCKRMSEAIKKFGQKTENKIKELSYISEINKNNEEAKDFFKEPIRTLNLTLDLSEENFLSSSCNCSSYYFSGLPVPENINIEENRDKNLVISWNNNENIIDYSDRYKIKYSIELMKCNNKSTFETSEKKIVFKKFSKDTNYKVRIKTVINESSSDWSKTKEFKIDESIKTNGLFGSSTLF